MVLILRSTKERHPFSMHLLNLIIKSQTQVRKPKTKFCFLALPLVNRSQSKKIGKTQTHIETPPRDVLNCLLLRNEPFNIYRGEGTSFEMMHAIFFQGTIVWKQFFSDVNVSEEFFFWKIFGMSSWHILAVKDMMYNRPWVIAIDSWRVGGSIQENCFLF